MNHGTIYKHEMSCSADKTMLYPLKLKIKG